MFQQDNAAVLTAKVIQEYFSKEKISVLRWPACSSNLEIIENCCRLLSRATYTEGRQFEDLHDSKSCNRKELENISQCTIKVLYKSLSIKMTEVIENHGASAHR